MGSRDSTKEMQASSRPLSTSYRLYFSCDHVGRYLPTTKRRIRWGFGFTDLHAADEGRCGIECRGEEHEVVLIWSLQSEKVRLFLNKVNISHFFREKPTSGKIDVSWESRSGEMFRIVAHEYPTRSTPQYDLFIDGSSVFSMPHVSDLSSTVISIDDSEECDDVSAASLDSITSSTFHLDDKDETRESPNAGFRLSLAGFPPFNPLDDVVDDLTSGYESTNNRIESLRRITTSLVQNSEDIVSRSIINALSEDNDNLPLENSWESSSTEISKSVQTPTLIEANILYETIEWSKQNVVCAPRPDLEEKKRLFFQKQMDAIFINAHRGRLSEDAASRIVLDVATILDFSIYPSIHRERDSLIIRDFNEEITENEITSMFMIYDELREVGIASNRNFAFCRFASERGPLRAFAAADKGVLNLNGNRPELSFIQKPLQSGRPGSLVRRAISSSGFHSDEPMPKPVLARRRSHQRNTISIDSLIVESPPFRRLINDIVQASPFDVASFEKEDYLGKMNRMDSRKALPSLSQRNTIYGSSVAKSF